MSEPFDIFRATRADRTAVQDIVTAYCDEIGVMVRDTPADMDKYFTGDASIWLARPSDSDASNIVGCVILRPLPTLAHAAEVKRLYVRQSHRGARLAPLLMDALHTYAITRGYRWIYLDTKDDLQAAIRLYDRLGYARCERYNDNPQATIFMRKQLMV